MKDEVENLLMAIVIWGSWPSWSATIIVVPKGDGGKCLVIDYHTLNEVTRKFIWPMPKVEDIFSQLKGAKYFSTLDLCAKYHHIPLDESSIPKTIHLTIGKIWIHPSTFWTHTSTGILPRTHDQSIKRF